MMVLIPVALALQVTVGVRVGQDTTAKARRERAAEAEAMLEDIPTRERRPVRRIPVTDEMRRTAFKDDAARSLLLRARVARLKQDAALASYDATTYQRLSVGMGFKAFGRERLALRHEEATRVQWERGKGALVEVRGERSAVPIVEGLGDKKDRKDAEADMSGMSSIPYYPGREDLWIGGGLARSEVDERNFVHPIAEGAEAYYTYATGDSVTMTLPDGKRILLRELRIEARSPKWNLSVGSFWFDEATARLVRAVYRLSATLDVWALAKEENALDRQDTSQAAVARRARRGNNNDDDPPVLVKAMLSPLKVDVSAITVEFGLYNQRFWLPRQQAMEGFAQAGFIRIPITLEERYKYATVNELEKPLAIAEAPPPRKLSVRDSLREAKVPEDKIDSAAHAYYQARSKKLAEEKERQCAATGMYTTVRRREEGTLNVTMQLPCDEAKLASSPELPPSIYDPGEELFAKSERDELVKALNFGLQAGWGPQPPTLSYGLGLTRYNRVEGFSTGLGVSSELGRGYTASATIRGSYADRQLNGDLTLSRTNGRATLHGAVYRRLGVMNDWGSPLDFGASLANLLYARDEGAYYRTWGAEFGGSHKWLGALDWRLFAEQQWKADVNTRWSLFGGANDSRFIANPAAQAATAYGASVRLVSSAGLDPNGWRVMSDVRAEGAGGGYSYARGLADLTVSHPLALGLAGALTTSAGYSAGTVPVQKQFYLGGLQTIRGETALTASGDAFWMTRAEIGLATPVARPVVFGDIGWAGDRRDFGHPGRPLSGAGIGVSFLDGLIRADLARGLYPVKQTRFDIYLEGKF
ncbi:MAG: hypothetical protein HY059_05875 [Proteobacteria bacterium]|nr:hypothetical protein [Pseudomonadota bacterium]